MTKIETRVDVHTRLAEPNERKWDRWKENPRLCMRTPQAFVRIDLQHVTQMDSHRINSMFRKEEWYQWTDKPNRSAEISSSSFSKVEVKRCHSFSAPDTFILLIRNWYWQDDSEWFSWMNSDRLLAELFRSVICRRGHERRFAVVSYLMLFVLLHANEAVLSTLLCSGFFL